MEEIEAELVKIGFSASADSSNDGLVIVENDSIEKGIEVQQESDSESTRQVEV